jgi:hypothetical protein
MDDCPGPDEQRVPINVRKLAGLKCGETFADGRERQFSAVMAQDFSSINIKTLFLQLQNIRLHQALNRGGACFR